MPSNEQADEPPERSPNFYWANFVGSAIAVLTLIIPLYIIAAYSSSNLSGNPSSQFQTLPSRNVR